MPVPVNKGAVSTALHAWDKLQENTVLKNVLADLQKNKSNILSSAYSLFMMGFNTARDFQGRVLEWAYACFDKEFVNSKHARRTAFAEEALELLQAADMPLDDVISLAKHVYSKPVGEFAQEVGGVTTTLATLCAAFDVDMHKASETELARIWTKIDAIREKTKAKAYLKNSPTLISSKQASSTNIEVPNHGAR